MPSILQITAEARVDESANKAAWCWAQAAVAYDQAAECPRWAWLRRMSRVSCAIALERKAKVHEQQMDAWRDTLHSELRRSEHYRVYEDPAA